MCWAKAWWYRGNTIACFLSLHSYQKDWALGKFLLFKRKRRKNKTINTATVNCKEKASAIKNVRTHKYVGAAHNVQRDGAAVDNGVVGPAEASKGQLTFE